MSSKSSEACVGIRVGGASLTLSVTRLGEGFDRRPMVLASESGERTTPSTVSFASNAEWLIGDSAKQQAHKNRTNTFNRLLHLVGVSHEELEAAGKLTKTSFSSAAEDSTGYVRLVVVDDAGTHTSTHAPGDLLSMLFQRLKQSADEFVGGNVAPCVLTCPLHFTEAQRDLMRSAGEAAGFHVLQVLSEPVAVLLGHELDVTDKPTSVEHEHVLVVDVGASVMDVSVVRVDDGVLSIVSSESRSVCTGDEMVTRIVQFAAKQFARKTGADPMESKRSVMRLRNVCENTLRFLSNSQQADIEIESLHEGCDLRLRVSRARFEDLCSDLWNAITPHVESVLAAAKLSEERVNRVVLAGGASRVPRVQSKLRAIFPDTPLVSTAPDEVAASGAASQAARMVVQWDSPGQPFFNYKKSKAKLHEQIPAADSLPCANTDLLLRLPAGSDQQPGLLLLVANQSVLPLCRRGLPLPPVHASSDGTVCLSVTTSRSGEALADVTLGGLPQDSLNFTVDIALSEDGQLRLEFHETTRDIHATAVLPSDDGDDNDSE